MTTTTQCPNRGPGRYEGQQYPCLAAAFDGTSPNTEVGSVQEIGHAAFFVGPIRAAGLCADCAPSVNGAAGGLGLFEDSSGFVEVETYADFAAYRAAVKHAEEADAAFNAEADLEA